MGTHCGEGSPPLAPAPKTPTPGINCAANRRLLGAICNEQGRKLNLRDWALAAPTAAARPRAYVVVVAGTSMNDNARLMLNLIRARARPGRTGEDEAVTIAGFRTQVDF